MCSNRAGQGLQCGPSLCVCVCWSRSHRRFTLLIACPDKQQQQQPGIHLQNDCLPCLSLAFLQCLLLFLLFFFQWIRLTWPSSQSVSQWVPLLMVPVIGAIYHRVFSYLQLAGCSWPVPRFVFSVLGDEHRRGEKEGKGSKKGRSSVQFTVTGDWSYIVVTVLLLLLPLTLVVTSPPQCRWSCPPPLDRHSRRPSLSLSLSLSLSISYQQMAIAMNMTITIIEPFIYYNTQCAPFQSGLCQICLLPDGVAAEVAHFFFFAVHYSFHCKAVLVYFMTVKRLLNTRALCTFMHCTSACCLIWTLHTQWLFAHSHTNT